MLKYILKFLSKEAFANLSEGYLLKFLLFFFVLSKMTSDLNIFIITLFAIKHLLTELISSLIFNFKIVVFIVQHNKYEIFLRINQTLYDF